MSVVERVERRPRRALTKESAARFLDVLREGWSATKAAEVAGLTRSMLYRRRAEDDEFAEAWQAAREEGIDRIVDEAVRRAVTGVERPVFGKGGEIVGSAVDYSDRLLELLLRGLRPETFGTSAKLTVSQQPAFDATDILAPEFTSLEFVNYLHELGVLKTDQPGLEEMQQKSPRYYAFHSSLVAAAADELRDHPQLTAGESGRIANASDYEGRSS